MAAQAMVAVLIAALVAAAIIMVMVSAAAVAALATAAAFAAMGVIESVAPEFQVLAALALTPPQAMLMVAMQSGGLATLTGLMQEVNLAMITATL